MTSFHNSKRKKTWQLRAVWYRIVDQHRGVTVLIVWEGQKRGGGSGFPEMYWVVHMKLAKTKHGAALTKPPRKSISHGK